MRDFFLVKRHTHSIGKARGHKTDRAREINYECEIDLNEKWDRKTPTENKNTDYIPCGRQFELKRKKK